MSTILGKTSQILTAWGIAISPNQEQNDIAAERLEICTKCEFKKTNLLNITYCGKCGCPLKGKSFSEWKDINNPEENPCPEKMWNR